MAADLSAPPVLSTPDDLIVEVPAAEQQHSTLSDDALYAVYEIPRTVRELRQGAWKRVALQFADAMLVDAPRVSEALARELATTPADGAAVAAAPRIYVLADTSYSACCVDEVAAEHADAEVVVHYGRACLSPTSRLPVIYVYTSQELDLDAAVESFAKEFPSLDAKVVVMADLTYQKNVAPLVDRIRARGYANVLGTDVVRDPAGIIPNRRIVDAGSSPEPAGPVDADSLREHALFHISDPPSSLLLALLPRFASLHVLPAPASTTAVENPTMRTGGLLRRRFARVLSLASAGVIGILVNTLSVANSLASIDLLRRRIADAGKKSYTVVVGRLNPAKLANFSEIEGWVVVGCWEGGLIGEDQESGYWRPVVTPFEMEVALMREEERIWGGEWWGGIERLKLDDEPETTDGKTQAETAGEGPSDSAAADVEAEEDGVEGEESMPPEYDLRTGRLVSHSRPMRLPAHSAKAAQTDAQGSSSAALIKRAGPGELASINGVASPGAEYLRSQRTWQGLGSDFAENQETSTVIEEGLSGIARGYRVGDEVGKH